MKLRPSFQTLFVVIACLTTVAPIPSNAAKYDLLIRGGKIADGTGNPWFYGNVAVSGDRIEAGEYAADVAIGQAKVEIRVPRPARGSAPATAGPGPGGPGGGGLIEESLPPKYNDATELTIDVQRGKNVKDWELSTK